MRVLVAGAGLAGLHAAWLLHRKGHDVTVCEARGRVGGRVWSAQLDNGAWVERGGEFVFPSDRVMLRLCADLGLAVIPHGFSFFRRASHEGTVPSAEHLVSVMARLAAVVPTDAGVDAPSLSEAFEAALGPRYGDDPVFLRTVTSLAADPRAVNAVGELEAEVTAGSPYLDHAFHVVGGNEQVAARLGAALGGRVRLESPVRAVDQSDRSVELTLEDGSRLSADVAVLAVPLPILTALERGFPWPGPVAKVLSALLMGTALKASVPLRAGVAPRGVQAPQWWWAWGSASPSEQRSAPSVTAFASTAPHVARAEREDAPWDALVQRLRPDVDVAGAALVTDWEHERWTRGSYSAPGLSWRPSDDQAFNAPVGRVVLAGEHTAAARGMMEGALRSGQRAARLLVASFG